mgnify:CR=1 FL=1
MQPSSALRRGAGSGAAAEDRPTALLARCQLMRWGSPHAAGPGPRRVVQHKRGLASLRGLRPQLPTLAVAPPQGQRSQLHTLSGRGAARGQLPAAAARATLLQGCTRLLSNLRMLRAF